MDPYVGEIRMFAGNFAPRGWALCDGQLLAVSQYDALFSLFGTIYGGDGRSTFGLPDMRGRIPLHQGTGPGLSNRRQGQKSGAERETLSVNHLPTHNHGGVRAVTDSANDLNPNGKMLAQAATDIYVDDTQVNMNAEAVTNTGSSQPHDNIQPFICVNFIVALFGIYPSR